MDSGLLPSPSDINKNTDNAYKWFFVQYSQGPHKFVRKAVSYDKLIWNKHVQAPPEKSKSSAYFKEHVFIQDRERMFLGHIIHKSVEKGDVIISKQIVEHKCIKYCRMSKEINDILDRMHLNKNFWLLVTYSTEKKDFLIVEETVFEIFHNIEVVLKKEQGSNIYTAFIQKQDATYKGYIIKVTCDLKSLMSTFTKIKNNANVSEKQIIDFNDLNDVRKIYKCLETKNMEHLNQEEIKQISEAIERHACFVIQYHLIKNDIMRLNTLMDKF